MFYSFFNAGSLSVTFFVLCILVLIVVIVLPLLYDNKLMRKSQEKSLLNM